MIIRENMLFETNDSSQEINMSQVPSPVKMVNLERNCVTQHAKTKASFLK